MIELTIAYPRNEHLCSEIVVFKAEHRGVNVSDMSPTDLRQARLYVIHAIRGIPGLALASDPNGHLAIAYNVDMTPWRTWYIQVIDAIMQYYRDNFPRQGFEVVHHTESYSDQAA